LKKWLADLGAAPSESWLRQLAQPLMQALAVLHEKNCLHRDVAPDNILMLYDRAAGNYLEQPPRPVLLDFGAARRVLADSTQNPTSLLKSGFSPVEQYDGEGNLRQGPWTDVYALCAVLYTAAIGRVPNAAIARLVRDDLAPARVAGRGRYTQAFLAAIDAGLMVRPEQRPQTLAELQQWFARPDPPVKTERTVPVPEPAAVDVPLEPHAVPTTGAKGAKVVPSVKTAPSAKAAPASTRWGFVAAAVAVALLAVVLFGRR